MNYKKFTTMILASAIAAGNIPSVTVYANENSVQVQSIAAEQGAVAVSSFNLAENAAYLDAFQVKGIKGYTTNGGQYQTSSLDKAFDGTKATHWETGNKNTAQHTNEIIVTFDEVESINRIIYAARQDASNKGFATKASIYISLSEEGNDFELVGTGTAVRTGGFIEYKFDTTKAKRIKFVFDEVYNEWASASELMFLKEDTVLDKVNDIFADAAKTTLKEAFKDAAVLEELEAEAKSHPLYSTLKETIEDAKILLSDKEITAGRAVASVFDYYDNAAYSERFRMDYANIKSIKTNGSHYAQQVINLAIDGNANTYWETRTANTDSFNNEVTLELKEAVTINRLVFGARPQDSKGFAQEFEIYATETSAGDNFKLIATGQHNAVKGLIEAKFEPAKVKRIKLVFKKSTQNWATLTELACYYEDEVLQEVGSLFTNSMMNELSSKYDTAEKIGQLEQAVAGHPLEAVYQETIAHAKKLLNGQVSAESLEVTTAVQRGYYTKGTADRYINGNAYTSFESTGKYVEPGETFIVYLDADPTGVMPQICLGAVGKATGNWRNFINLSPGKNVITAPAGTEPRAIYLVNNASPSEQAYAPSIRIEGGTSFPVYVHGKTDPQAYYDELVAYSKNIEYSDEVFRNGNPQNKEFNIAEFVSENCLITTSAMGAIAGLNEAAKQGYNVADTMDSWEEMYEMFQGFLGLEEDAEDVKDSYFPNKFIGRVFVGVPLGYADHGYTGYLGDNPVERDGGFFKLIAMPIYAKGNDNWCYNHEFGHIFNTKHMVHGEVTNNLFAQEYRRIKNLGGDRVDWNGLMKRFQGEEVQLGFWTNLGILSQLNIAYGYDAYAKASKALRSSADAIKGIQGSELRRLAVAYSLGLGVNLLDFFEGWGYTDVTPEMEALVSHLPKETRKIEYLHNGAYDYIGTGFTADVMVSASVDLDEASATHTLKFGIDSDNADGLLGYEILKDGQVIGFTRSTSFTVKNVDITENANYEVVAYAKDLTTAKPVSTYAFAPTLTVEQQVTLKLNEAFDPMAYVSAASYAGAALENIEVSHQVDTTKRGTYTAWYTVTDKGVTAAKEMIVNVVSDYDYLSDRAWDSVATDYGTPRRNSGIKGRINGEIQTFEKGIGIHANGEVVYQLGGHNYESFEALLGVDMGIAPQDYSSIKFEVFVDGKAVAATPILKHADNMVKINVPIAGAKELKIVVNNGGNGNTCDHAVIASPKLITNNAQPVVTVEEDAVLKLGETMDDIFGSYSAYDAEDGDLTASVETSGSVNFKRPGKYTLTYTVADKDGNTSSKERTISIIDMADYTYVSDSNWSDSSCQWGSIKKDKSPSDNTIRLTNEEGKETAFAKGLGAHAKSSITYDLSKIDAGFFSAYVGVDRAMYHSVGSVSFEVWLDGKKVADTGLMNAKDKMAYIEVNLGAAKELKLVATDGGNGNGSDHAVWADAKFHFANPDNIPTDFEELAAYIKSLNLLDSSRYTDESWTSFAEVKAEAEALLEADDVKQETVDAMLEALEAAEQALVAVGDKADLRSLVAEAQDLSGWLYTAASWEALQSCIEEAKEVLYAIPDQMAVNAAQEKLSQAVADLVLSEGKRAVKIALDKADDYLAAVYGNAPMWQAFTSLQEELSDLYYAATPAEEEGLTRQAEELEEMMTSLDEWLSEQADKSELQSAITDAKALDLRTYTKASKEGFKETLALAEKTAASSEAEQADIDAAAAQLERAMDKLELSDGKAQLKVVLERAATINKEDYTNEEYWNVFELCYEHYQAVYEEDYEEVHLYIAHVYFTSIIDELETYGK